MSHYNELFISINRILPTIEGQITSVFSYSIFVSILSLGNVTTIGAIFVSLSLFFIISDNQIRKLVKKTSEGRLTKNWLIIVDFLMDDFYRFFIFIIIQYIDLFIKNSFFGDQQSVLEQIVSVFCIACILTFVITIVESFQTNDTGITVFLRVWNGMYGVAIQFFSIFIFKQIKELPQQSQIGLISISILVFYLIFEWAVRKLIDKMKRIDSTNRNLLWYTWINKLMDSLVVFSFFFVLRYIGDGIGSMSDSNRLSILGRFVVLFCLYIITYTIFGIIMYFSEYNLSGSIFINTFSRIWSKISGNTTGLFSIIIIEDVFNGSQQNQLLMVSIAMLIFYSSIDPFLRKIIQKSSSVKDNPQWASIISQLLDFPLALTPILIFNVITNYLNSKLENNSNVVFTHILIVITLQILATSIFTLLKFHGFY